MPYHHDLSRQYFELYVFYWESTYVWVPVGIYYIEIPGSSNGNIYTLVNWVDIIIIWNNDMSHMQLQVIINQCGLTI